MASPSAGNCNRIAISGSVRLCCDPLPTSVVYFNAEVPSKTYGEFVARHRAAAGERLLASPSKSPSV